MKPKILDAVEALDPNCTCSISDGVLDLGENVNNITNSQVDTKLVELQAEYDAQEYARNRQAEYPTIADLVVALYDTDDKSAVEAKRAAVKAKYPKPD